MAIFEMASRLKSYNEKEEMLRTIFFRLGVLLLLSTSAVLGRVSSVIVKDLTWKANSSGNAYDINVCFIAQNSSSEVATAKAILNETWAYYANLNFNFEPVRKMDGTIYSCTEGFPGIRIDLKDVVPHSDIGVDYKATPASENTLWPGKMMPITVNMTLNKVLVSYPQPDEGGSNELDSWDKELLFKQQIVHEFGHALGFNHEHFHPKAEEELQSACKDHITLLDSPDKVGALPKNSKILGTYSRLSIMHYECPEGINRKVGDIGDVQLYLGPSDIATIRALYGVRNPEQLRLAVWGRSDLSGDGLEDIDFRGDEDLNELVFDLGGAPGNAKVNHKYFTASKNLAEKTDPKPGTGGGMRGGPSWDPIGLFLSGEYTQNGLPIFYGESIDGTVSVPIEVGFSEKNKVINSVSYPGYEFTLKHLGNSLNFNSFDWDQSYRNQAITPSRALFQFFGDRKFESGNFTSHTLPHHASPPVNLTGYNVFQNFPNGFIIWIPKGYGAFDPQRNEFYLEFDSPPKDGNWIVMPSGKFRINTNYTYAQFGLSVGKVGDESHRGMALGNDLKVSLPYHPKGPQTYLSILKNSTRDFAYMPASVTPGGKRLAPFRIGKMETTFIEYFLLRGHTITTDLSPYKPVTGINYYHALLYCNKRSELEGLQPVYSYSSLHYNQYGNPILNDLQTDLAKNGYRLPTVEEWKFAYYPSGPRGSFHWGESESDANRYAWYRPEGQWYGHPGGLKMPNSRGIYDMNGNMAEWVHRDINPAFGTVIGGSFNSTVGELKVNISPPNNVEKVDPSPLHGFRIVRKAVDLTPIRALLLD